MIIAKDRRRGNSNRRVATTIGCRIDFDRRHFERRVSLGILNFLTWSNILIAFSIGFLIGVFIKSCLND